MPAASEILAQLDECAADYNFPLFSGQESSLLATQLSVFYSSEYWCIVMQWLAREWGYIDWDRLTSELQIFGNNLTVAPGHFESFARFRPGPDNLFQLPIGEDPMVEMKLDRQGDRYWVRDSLYDLPIFWRRQIPNPDLVGEYNEGNNDLAKRILDDIGKTHADETWMTQEELSSFFKTPIPLNSTLSVWLHPDIPVGEMPSENAFFRDLASHIEKGGDEPFQYSGPTNTNGEYWAELGP